MNRLNKVLLAIILISFCLTASLPGRIFVVVAKAALNECPQTPDPNLLIGEWGGSVHCYLGQTTTCDSIFMCPTSKLSTTRLRLAADAPTWVSLNWDTDPNKFQHDWHIELKPVSRSEIGMRYVTVYMEQLLNGSWQTEKALTVVLCIEEEFVIEPLTGCSAGR
jgi:hypothetical protein